VVGVGSRRPQPDIDVKSITAPARAAIATAYKAEVVVSVKNLQNKEVEIELLKDGDVVDSRQISADSFVTKGQGQSRSKTIEFTLGAERLGSYVLSARAKVSEKAGEGALAGEVNTANNIRSTMVEVVEEARLKVLFYCQRANFNIGKIRQALARDKKIELDLALDVVKSPVLSAEALKSSSYVKLPEGRDGFNTYDVIILGACEPDSLSRTQIDSLYSFSADRGGGLIVLPGRDEFGPDAWVDRKTKSLVPAIFKPEEVTFDRFEPGKMKLTLEGIDSKFISPEVLEEFDEPTSAYYRTVVTKPAATTLALAEDTPVISVHRVGRGRICLLNVSKLFLLYREDLQGGLLYELMAGLTAYVGRVRNREAGVRMFAERSNDQTDKVKFSAYVCDKSFEPVTGANVLLTVSQDVLIMNELGDGYYTAEIKDTEGLTITATAQAEVDGIFLGEKTIAVNLPPVRGEMTNVEFDESFLKNLSQKLNARYYYADDIGEDIAKTFKARTSSSGSPRMTSIWPNWLVLLVLCTLLSINWYLRRAVGLV
jgi:hypothetical protein